GGDRRAAAAQDMAHHVLHEPDDRAQRPDDAAHGGGDQQRQLVGVVDGIGLGQDLAEDDDQHGHDDGGVDHPTVAEQHDEGAGRQRGGQDVDQVVAEQHGADDLLHMATQAIHHAGLLVALALQRMHARPRGGGERGLGGGEEGGAADQQQDGDQAP